MSSVNKKNRRKKYEKKRNQERISQRRKAKVDKEPPKISENGRRIRKFMIENDVKGNYKDFVIIAGDRLIDHNGSHRVLFMKEGEVGGPLDGIALFHKKDLHSIIDPKFAARFWHPRLGRVGAFIKPALKK